VCATKMATEKTANRFISAIGVMKPFGPRRQLGFVTRYFSHSSFNF
jgi:hypothetical protein